MVVFKRIKIVLSIGSMFFFVCYLYPSFFAIDNNRILVTVNNGDSASVVASRLKNNGLVFSKKLFLCLVKITKSQKKIKAGVYSFSKKNNMFEILKKLNIGLCSVLRFTIPEGSNVKQTAEIISKTVNINKEKFIKIAKDKNMEGYLMPETYFVTPVVNEEKLIEMMFSEFKKKIKQCMYERAKEINVDFKNIIIMASIIEKEAIKSEEKPIIASVFYNRLSKHIKLQSCATVLYAIERNKSKLTFKDTKFNSPYNTYMYFGFPPGPICSPGIESIKAALYPANTKNLFFVSDKRGRHLFAKNFDEHRKNIQSIEILKIK
ncbi:MAG: endolytic transglycosylase MltG [Endomicrobium sp.]|nr:endolytic transglycosylase MltG [Endomicrobium sp.]